MATLGETLRIKRVDKRITLTRLARDLKIKKELLEALEKGDWGHLPEPTFVKGFITSCANYLGLDAKHLLALYRREFDESKYPRRTFEKPQKIFLTPSRITGTIFALLIIGFIIYVAIQYSSILSAPKLQVSAPPDDYTTNIPAVLISGQVEKGATVSVDGEFAPVDSDGNFSYQLALKDGQNIIEIIAAKRLSPKSKITRIIRFSR